MRENLFFFFVFQFYLKEKSPHRRETGRAFPSSISLKWPRWPGLGRLYYVGLESQSLRPFSTSFPDVSVRRWMESRTAELRTSAQMGCQHHRLSLPVVPQCHPSTVDSSINESSILSDFQVMIGILLAEVLVRASRILMA